MSARTILLVMQREILERVRSRAFQISTLVLVAAAAAATAAPQLLRESQRHYDVGVAGHVAPGTTAALSVVARSAGETIAVHRVERAAVPAALARGDVQAVLVDERRLVVQHDVDARLRALVQTAVVQSRLGTLPRIEITRLDGGGRSSDARNVAVGAVVLLYFALIFSGTWVASGIVEEKSSRVVEVVLSTLRPVELLAGKVLGIGLVALAQVAAATTGAAATGIASGSIHLPDNFPAAAASVVGWFVLGYALYASVFAAGAALVSRQEDLPAVTTPVNLVMGAAFLTAMTAAENPDGPLLRVLSFVPPFSPLIMPLRASAGDLAPWELPVAVLLTAATIAAVAWVAVRAYTGLALRSGARVSLRTALYAE